MYFLYLIFYGCLRLRFLDVETNPGQRRPVPAVCRILCSNVRGMALNLSDLTVDSSQYDILLCSETLVSDMRLDIYVYSLYRNPDLDDRIFDCLLASMAAV